MARPELKEREVTGYLKPSNSIFFRKYIATMEIGKSEAINEAVKALKACLPPEQLRKIMSKNSY